MTEIGTQCGAYSSKTLHAFSDTAHYMVRHLKWPVVEKFQVYLYGSAFEIYTKITPYICSNDGKAGCFKSLLGGQPCQLQFSIVLQSRGDKHWCRTLSMVSWPRCVPNTSDTHHWVTAVAVLAMQEATLKGPVSPIEAYSCDLHILDPVGDGLQVAYMTTNDWYQAQWQTLSLALWLWGCRYGTLGQSPFSTNWPTQVLTAASRMQPPQTEAGHPV